MDERWQWPSEQSRRLLDTIRDNHGVHAYLLTGAEGVGKRTAAMIYAGAMLCDAEPALRPCGVCGPCTRLASGSHPDVYLVTPGDNRSNTISIDTVRATTAALASRPYEGGIKIALIFGADYMEPRAQNALLKTLEDPPGNCAIFLTAERGTELLPTIRSRCLLLPIPALSIDGAEHVLVEHGFTRHDAQEAAEYADGAVGVGLKYLDEIKPIKRKVEGVLNSVRGMEDVPAGARELASIIDDGPDKYRTERVARLFSMIEYFANDGIGKAPELFDSVNSGAYDDDVSLGERLGHASVRARLFCLDAVHDARRRVSMHISLTSTLEILLFDWMEGFTIGSGRRYSVPKR